MKNMNKWFYAFVGVAIALVVAIVVAIVVGVNSGKTPDEIPEGAETGIYYYDAEDGEWTVHLHSGNQFTLNDGVARIGEYTVDGTTISFTFKKESNGTATAQYADGVLTMTYNGQQIRFLEKVSYTVSFDAQGGSATASATVINGKSADKPADPTKTGYAFIGWFTDSAMTKPFVFGSSIITSDTTLYAGWVEKSVGQVEYTVDFVGADVEAMTTSGGKIFGLPTPEKTGYTFGGWWISAYEDGEKLTYKCEEGTAITANTTLFAVWTEDTGSKLAAPMVQVTESGISWGAVSGASAYAVKITAPDGTVVFEDNVSATTKNVDFTAAGCYTVEVTAVAANSANNSDVTVRYYAAKTLNRVSLFEVVEPSVLLFNAVEGAQKYYITVKCGNPDHNHTSVDNGNSTVYSFANCAMTAEGIEFTVTAAANGYASSVSETFVYVRALDAVTDITVNENETLVWNPVKGAAYYTVEITCGEHGTHTVTVNTASLSVKGCSGSVAVKVTPVTEGYASPAATEYTYTKATLAAPAGVSVNGTVVSWTAVQGATSYTVKVGTKTFNTSTASLDLATVELALEAGADAEISVMAEGAGKTSLYSDAISTKYLTFVGNVVYANGTVSWTPALGAGYYEVKVDDGAAATVNAASTQVSFTSAGKHTVSVRFVGSTVASDWYTVDVTVYAIVFDSRLGTAVDTIYVAIGDKVSITGTPTRSGYTFNGWYTTPTAASGNGKLYTETYYTAQDDTVLYAEWKANSYNVVYGGSSNVTGTESVTFNKDFTLGVPTSDSGSFIGWYSGPGGSGWQVTDAYGKSLAKYTTVGDLTVYPLFETGTLKYIEQEDGTYAVTAGPSVHNVAHVIVPQSYKGAAVTTVLENAFKACTELKSVSIPNTVTVIGTGAFTGCYELESIEIREVEGVQEPVYSSSNGALIRKDVDSSVYLEYVPMGMKGEYTVPNTVDTIRNSAFRYTYYLKKVTVSESVTYVADQAFINCPALEEIVFVGGGNKNLTVEVGAFENCKKLASITLPARLASIDTASLNELPKLAAVNVEAGGSVYGSVDGMLTNAERSTIVYCPPVKGGDLVVPVGVTAIGDGAFANCEGITSLVVSNKVTGIGASAFENCTGLESVVFEGGRNVDLTIADSAFKGCTGMDTLTFAGTAVARSASVARDAGAITIGASAFEGCSAIINLTIAENANITSIGAYAFSGCSGISAVVIPATVTAIGNSAYAGCSNVKSVTFEENGAEIAFGASVFSGCSKITSIYLPATLTSFDGSVFNGCDSISEIVVDDDNPILKAEGGVLYNKAQTEVIFYPKAADVAFSELPETINKISASAFQGNTGITEIVIPASITEIGDNAFEGCINLTSVTFENAIDDVKIGAYAFANCPALATVELPAGLTEISDYTFYKSAVPAITIPAAVETIGSYAFAYTSIADLVIPANVTTVKDAAFYNCKSLTSLTVEEGDKPLALGSLDDTVGVFANHGSKFRTANLSKRINVIGSKAFYDGYLYYVDLPADAKLEAIGSGAFYYIPFKAESDFNLPEGLKIIGDKAFYKSYLGNGKDEVVVPSTVESIGKDAFNNTYATKYTFAEGTVPLAISDYAFASNSKLTEINFPARLDKVYNEVIVGYYENIPMTSFYTVVNSCSKLTAINVADGCAKFSDINGIFCENDENGNPATVIYCPKAYAGEVTIPSTVTLVANGAFDNVNSITKVTFEEKADWDGVPTLTIGSYDDTFYGSDYGYMVFRSSSITEINLPKHLKALNSASFVYLTASSLKINFAEGTAPISLGYYAFYKNSNLTELKLPPLAKLGRSAINSNNSLTTVTIDEGSTLTTISAGAIQQNKALTAFEVPASVTTIENYALSNNSALKVTFAEGSKLTYIGSGAFQSTAITSFVFPESVTEVGSHLFMYCNNLTSVTLSEKMTSVIGNDGSAIFAGNTSISEIIVPEGNKNLVIYQGVLYDKNKTVLMFCPPSMDHSGVTIPTTVTSIEDYALYKFSGSELILHEGLVKIGNYALYGSTAITAVTIPASVKTIGEYAFGSSSGLAEVNFAPGSALESIGGDAFYDTDIVTIVLPDSITTIGEQAFRYCQKLECVELPTGITELPAFLFTNCIALKTVDMYEGITVINDGVFDRCQSLESITIPASVLEFTFEWTGAFDSCTALAEVIFAEGSKLNYIANHTFNNCSSLTKVTLPAGVAELPAQLFSGCTSLTEVVILGEVESIPANIFAGFTSLETVVLPETVKTIGASAFDGCTSLKNIALPEGIEQIGEAAFRGCTALETVSIGESIEEIGASAFDGCTALNTVTFADGVEITRLGEATFRNTTALTSIALPETVKTIGASIFENSGLTAVELPASLVAVSDYAFAGCAGLEKVVIPSTVKSVGNYAFKGCTSLTEAELEHGIESIGSAAFLDCTSLAKVNVPATVINIAGNPFINCPELAELDLDANNESFKFVDGALYDSGMYTLIYYLPGNEAETVELPASVTSLSAGAFYGSQLKSIVIPDNIKSIPEMLFMDSKKLESVVIKKNVTTIGDKAFSGCESITAIVINETVASVGDYAFAGCSALAEVAFNERNTGIELGTHLFDGCTALTTIELTEYISGITDYMFANSGIVSITLPATVTDLSAEGVFAGAEALTSVSLPEDAEGKLGDKFFYNCKSLASIELPEGIDMLGDFVYTGEDWNYDGVFDYINGLVAGPDAYTFAGCESLESINLTNVHYVGSYSFYGCTSLTDIIFGEEISGIGNYAFADCTALTEIDMRDSYTWSGPAGGYMGAYVFLSGIEFGEYAFSGCTSLESFLFPDDYVSNIRDGLFAGCTSLMYVCIVDVNNIHGSPFYGMPEGSIIYFAGNYDAYDIYDYFVYYFSYAVYDYVLSEDWVKNTVAKIVGTDGSVLSNDCTVCNAMYTIDADGVVNVGDITIDAEGNVSQTLVFKLDFYDGSIRYPDGLDTLPYGIVFDGTAITLDNGTVITKNSTTYPDGVANELPSWISVKWGVATIKVELVIDTEGNVSYPEGYPLPEGMSVTDGIVTLPDGTTVEAGAITFSNGVTVNTDKVVTFTDGTTESGKNIAWSENDQVVIMPEEFEGW